MHLLAHCAACDGMPKNVSHPAQEGDAPVQTFLEGTKPMPAWTQMAQDVRP